MDKAPETDEILTLFKGLIDIPTVQNVLEPTSDSSDKIFVPDGNVLTEQMDFNYWSRIVLLQRISGEGVSENESRTIPFQVHCRVDIQPPNDPNYKVDQAMQRIHREIDQAVRGKVISPQRASIVMPFFRVRRPLNAILNKYGYFTTYAIFKTGLGTYE